MQMGIRYYGAGELKEAEYHLLKSILMCPSQLFEILRLTVSITLARYSMGKKLILLGKKLKNR